MHKMHNVIDLVSVDDTEEEIPYIGQVQEKSRMLNRWGFSHIAHCPDAGAFCHAQFQREQPDLHRNMVYRKSRRLSKMVVSAAGEGVDDYSASSASSASNMVTKQCVALGDKRPYSSTTAPYSSTVTVSTAGATFNKRLPFKKRKPGKIINFTMNDIPSTVTVSTAGDTSNNRLPFKKRKSEQTRNDIRSAISHRCQKWPAMPATPSSMAKRKLNSDGPVNSVTSSHAAGTTDNTAARAPAVSTEAAAVEALAHHFLQQKRAFALASLRENSRLAIRAAWPTKYAAAPVAAHWYSAARPTTTSVPGFMAPTAVQGRTPSTAAVQASAAAISAEAAARSALAALRENSRLAIRAAWPTKYAPAPVAARQYFTAGPTTNCVPRFMAPDAAQGRTPSKVAVQASAAAISVEAAARRAMYQAYLQVLSSNV